MAMYRQVLKFWFEETKPAQWWQKDEAFDLEIATRFGAVHMQAVRCELYPWRSDPRGRLAEIIVLDQFSRNMFRGQAQSFAHDALALALAQEAVAAGAHASLNPVERSFLYMPYMHSESLLIHEQAVALFRDNNTPGSYEYELKHKAIIERFGRYPHRNAVLGRTSTPQELLFLELPGSGF
jgi:uncharacterized protein (DUF924 family)